MLLTLDKFYVPTNFSFLLYTVGVVILQCLRLDSSVSDRVLNGDLKHSCKELPRQAVRLVKWLCGIITDPGFFTLPVLASIPKVTSWSMVAAGAPALMF